MPKKCSSALILYAEYENNLYLIIRLHFYPFYFGLGRAGLARTQPEPVTGWPEKARAGRHGLARKSLSLSRPGPKKPGPKRPGPRLARAEFGPRVNCPGRLEQKSPHKARVARPEGQH
jgi:hypothetical protein